LPYGRAVQEEEGKRVLAARRKALKTKSDYLKEAQVLFNRYIRLRDELLPCVSCGRFHNGKWNAGHYRPVGGRSGNALRFNEDNCHKQCEPCNSHLSGALSDYRIELVRRIGKEKVEWLEGPHDHKKYTIEEIEAIKKEYRQKIKNLKRMSVVDTPF
jgi:hypothetical protein